MEDDSDYEIVTEFELEVDQQEADRSTYTASEERSLSPLGRDNRIGVAMRAPRPAESDDPNRAVYDIGLMLAVHAHPECRFVWSRLVVDLSRTPNAMIEDMVPDKVEDSAVEIETSIKGLKFVPVLKVINVEVNPELARKRTTYFPTMTASGAGFRKAYWDFMAKGNDYLHANRELRLLISAPAGQPVVAALVVRARVRLLGVKNLVPLRKRGSLEATINLVPGTAQIGE
ncbi:MAG: hypothetical protein ACRET2_05485 [Steroidobacteraceae bacterium]